jgi:hypothetical protein
MNVSSNNAAMQKGERTMPWYSKGEEGKQAVSDFEDERASKLGGAYRLWIPAGGSTQFTFLDTEGFFFKEHNYFHNRSWMNWETCLQDIGEEDCPFCEAGIRVYYECVFSVIDHAEYESKKNPGKIIRNTKKLLVLRSTARKKILRKRDQQEGDLRYVRMSTNRDDSKECSTGEDFEIVKSQTKAEVLAYAPTEYMGQAITPEAWIEPFDYIKLFQPKKAAALERIIGRVSPVGAGDGPSKGASGDEKEGSKPATSGNDKGAPSVHSLING